MRNHELDRPTAQSPDRQILFDSDFLKKLEYLYIISKRLFGGQARAERRARKLGSGLEFADHRGYSPGDDFRYVDWKAFQRLEKLLVRLFEEEQDLPIYLFLDTSRSMGVTQPLVGNARGSGVFHSGQEGELSKLDYGRQIAAALAYIGLAQLDRVTLCAFSERLHRELHGLRGKGQIFKAFSFLTGLVPDGHTRAEDVFVSFCTTRRKRGMVVVISDFFHPGGFGRGLDVLRYYQHELFMLHVTSASDADPPLRGDVRLVDSELGLIEDVAITPSLIEAYRRTYDRFCEELASYCWRHGIGYIRTPVEMPFDDAILKVFRKGGFLG